MNREKSSRLTLRTFALLAIVAGVLSLLGVKPMNGRTIELTLGSASLLVGMILLGMTFRTRTGGTESSIA